MPENLKSRKGRNLCGRLATLKPKRSALHSQKSKQGRFRSAITACLNPGQPMGATRHGLRVKKFTWLSVDVLSLCLRSLHTREDSRIVSRASNSSPHIRFEATQKAPTALEGLRVSGLLRPKSLMDKSGNSTEIEVRGGPGYHSA